MIALLLLILAALAADPGARAFERGDLDGAIAEWTAKLERARAPSDRFDLLLKLAAAHRRLGALDQARRRMDEAERVGLSDAASVARLQLDTGLLLHDLGELRRSEERLRKAFAGYREAERPAGAANAALDLGRVRLELGRIDDATKALDAAYTLYDTLDDGLGRADTRYQQARAARRVGRLATARDHANKALGAYQAVGDRLGEADALTLLGLVLQDLGQDDDARSLFDTALSTSRARGDRIREAGLRNLMGTLEHRADDPESAETHYLAAEQIFLGEGLDARAAAVGLNRGALTGDPEAFEVVVALAKKIGDRRLEAVASLNLAAVTGQSRALARARDLADALELSEVRWRARYFAGRADLKAGRRKAAIAHLEAAVEELERSRRDLDDDEARRFVVQREDVYQTLVDALLQQGEGMKAFVYAQRLQLVDLDSSGLSGTLAERFRELQAETAALEDALSADLETEGGRADEVRERLAALRVEFAAVVDELRALDPDFDRLVRIDPSDLEAIQSELDPGTVVLQPILLEDRLVLLVFRRDRLVPVTVDLARKDLVRAVRRLTRSLQAGYLQDLDWTRRTCDRLGRWLIEPILPELDGADVLVVSAHGVLRELPFGLLRADGKYLVERVAIANVTHVGSLGRGGERYRLRAEELLLVGNPDGTLPGAEAEVEAIAKSLPGSTALIGKEGTRRALYDAGRRVSTLHLATHGIIDPSRPDRSYLVLAGKDGRLGYREIPALSTWLDRARLVVLSACESGLPVQADPREGEDQGPVIVSIEGLAAQFRRAGVETLVASLWKVDDDGTLLLMKGMYAELAAGADIATALQRSKVRMLREEKWENPWFWAGFVVTGDWR